MPDPNLSRLPVPDLDADGNLLQANWNAVALFFNLVPARQPQGYKHTRQRDAENWLDEGDDPCTPTISAFMANYWCRLSNGRVSFGVDTPRDGSGKPFVPTLDVDEDFDLKDWGAVIRRHLEQSAEVAWKAAGEHLLDGKRWIPSLILVQRYPGGAQAHFGGFTETYDGKDYLISDVHRMNYEYDLTGTQAGGADGREFWGTVVHEHAHNFAEMSDLYGPSGAILYWDLLGDASAPGMMSEICSVFKEPLGWVTFKSVIKGPKFTEKEFVLKPYSSSYEALKVVPDPYHTPEEYFVLEYRKSTGTEPWCPDGGLAEEGLLIIHVNAKHGIWNHAWTKRPAPYLDPEFADARDRGTTLRTGGDHTAGVLFPFNGNDAFTPDSFPNSDFYGGRRSGLAIRDIRVEGGVLRFSLSIAATNQRGWHCKEGDCGVAGRFTPEAAAMGQEIFLRNNQFAALLVHREAHWHVVTRQNGYLGNFRLWARQSQIAGDFDGDGLDELFIWGEDRAGLVKWKLNGFKSIDHVKGFLGSWHLQPGDQATAIGLDPGGRKDIVLRRDRILTLARWDGDRLGTIRHHVDGVGDWDLDADDQVVTGRFTQQAIDEVLIHRGKRLGVLQWQENLTHFTCDYVEHDHVDGWALGGTMRFTAGDFDGDGLDEVYARRGKQVAVLKWNGDRFIVLWSAQDEIPYAKDEDEDKTLALTDDDLSYPGRLRADRDGVLHRGPGSLAVLVWNEDKQGMEVIHFRETWEDGLWKIHATDQFIHGDFHDTLLDPNDDLIDATDFVGNNLSDYFIVGEGRTAMLSMNYVKFHPDKDPHDALELPWHRPENLMLLEGGSDTRSVVAIHENADGRNLLFLDELTGATMDLDTFVHAIEVGLYPDYHIRKIKGRKVPVSNPNTSALDNLDRHRR